MALTLYFLRHGQTPQSRDNVFCGSGLDPELTPAGRAMAEAFAAAYRRTRWAAIYASPLRRTLETARPLCAALGLEPEVRDGLREIAYGAWEGLAVAAVDQRFHDDHVAWTADPAWYPPTGGESAIAVSRRAIEVVEEVQRRCDGGNVLLVSHKATIRIALCALLGVDVGRFRYRLGCPVGAVSVVELAAHGPLLRALADRAHLPAELRGLDGT